MNTHNSLLFRNLRHYFHYLLTLYPITAPFISQNRGWLLFHIFACLLIISQFAILNKCVLSMFDYEEDNGYSRGLLEKIGINISEDTLCKINYLWFLIPMIYSIYLLNKLLKK